MNYVIKTADELTNPFLCFCLFKRYTEITERNYIDDFSEFINGGNFVYWLAGKNLITSDELEKIVQRYPNIIFLDDVLRTNVLFANSKGRTTLSALKGYELLAEYMCQTSRERKTLFDSVNDEYNFNFDLSFNKEDGISCVCKFDIMELGERFFYSDIIKKKFLEASDIEQNFTYKELFHMFQKLTISECD